MDRVAIWIPLAVGASALAATILIHALAVTATVQSRSPRGTSRPRWRRLLDRCGDRRRGDIPRARGSPGRDRCVGGVVHGLRGISRVCHGLLPLGRQLHDVGLRRHRHDGVVEVPRAARSRQWHAAVRCVDGARLRGHSARRSGEVCGFPRLIRTIVTPPRRDPARKTPYAKADAGAAPGDAPRGWVSCTPRSSGRMPPEPGHGLRHARDPAAVSGIGRPRLSRRCGTGAPRGVSAARLPRRFLDRPASARTTRSSRYRLPRRRPANVLGLRRTRQTRSLADDGPLHDGLGARGALSDRRLTAGPGLRRRRALSSRILPPIRASFLRFGTATSCWLLECDRRYSCLSWSVAASSAI